MKLKPTIIMKNFFYTLFVSLFVLSCTTIENKSENHRALLKKMMQSLWLWTHLIKLI